MEHQLFETWIIDEIELTADQSEALAAHLKECPTCRQLSQSWKKVAARLEAAPAAQPAPGFSQRFQASLAERRLHQQQLQIRRLLLFLVLGSILSFFTLVVLTLTSASPVDLIVSGLQNLTQLFVNFEILQHGVVSLFSSVPLIIPVALWIVVTSAFAILALIWAIALWRISFQGVYQK